MADTLIRRVAIFTRPMGAHSSSNAYLKMDEVQHGMSIYQTVQDVPAGTSITNTAYWFKRIDGDTINAAESERLNQ